jgi:hypothetical protein
MNDAEILAASPEDQPMTFMDGAARTPRSRTNMQRCRWPLLTLIVAVFFAMGHRAGAYQKEQEQLRAKAISAEKYELRGPDNKLRASLFRGSRGGALLSFFDQDGRSRLSLGIDAQGTPIISLFDDKEAQRMGLSLDSHDDGTPQIVFFDGDREPALHLGITKGFGPDISVGKRGQGRVSIFLTKEGSPAVQLVDPKGNPRIAIGVFDDGPLISLLGDDRVVRATWRVLPDGSASFSLSDGQGRQRLAVMTDKQGKSSIRFIDPDRNESREIR